MNIKLIYLQASNLYLPCNRNITTRMDNCILSRQSTWAKILSCVEK